MTFKHWETGRLGGVRECPLSFFRHGTRTQALHGRLGGGAWKQLGGWEIGGSLSGIGRVGAAVNELVCNTWKEGEKKEGLNI